MLALFWAIKNVVQTGWFIYIILTRISRGSWISNQKFEIQPVATHTAIFVFQPHYGHLKNWIFTNWDNLYVILTQFSRRFWIWTQKFEIHPVAAHVAILYYSLFWKKYNLHQSGCSIYHPDQNFQRILNIQPEILNLACGNKYSYICIMYFSHTATLRDIWPSPIRMIHISSWLKSQGESKSGLRNLKFSLWQHVQLYLYISHITGRFDFHQTRWTIHHPKPIFEENLDLKSEFQNSTNSIHIWHITVLVNTCMLYYAISRNPTIRIICLTYGWYKFTYWLWIREFSVKFFTTGCTADITVIHIYSHIIQSTVILQRCWWALLPIPRS